MAGRGPSTVEEWSRLLAESQQHIAQMEAAMSDLQQQLHNANAAMAAAQAAAQAATATVVATAATAAAGTGGVPVTVSAGTSPPASLKPSILKENMTLHWLISGFTKSKAIVCCKGSRRSTRFALPLPTSMQTC